MSEIPNFDALVTRKALSGDKVQINDILNKPMRCEKVLSVD